jgi:hypothetical protein
VSCQQTFTSLGGAVPPQTMATLTMPVLAQGAIADIDVRLWADAPATTFTLGRNSAGTTVLLDDFGNATLDGATFDDEATITRPPDQTVYAGRYRPQQALSVFDGMSVADTWQLVVSNEALNEISVGPWELIVTYADCELDTDSDGVPDESDQCPTVPGDSISGCPAISRTLSFGWSDGAWRGRLSSDRTTCHRQRPVRIFRVDAGPDTRVATATTRRDGSWTEAAGRPQRSFYAVAPQVVVPGVGICAKARTANKTF